MIAPGRSFSALIPRCWLHSQASGRQPMSFRLVVTHTIFSTSSLCFGNSPHPSPRRRNKEFDFPASLIAGAQVCDLGSARPKFRKGQHKESRGYESHPLPKLVAEGSSLQIQQWQRLWAPSLACIANSVFRRGSSGQASLMVQPSSEI